MNVLLLILGLSVLRGLPVRAQITSSPSSDDDVQVRVMSFNIRYGTASDGDNHWDQRREFLLETIRTFNPDLLGTQETLKFQRDWLAAKLPDYEVLGVGRNDGKDDGEMMALYFRRDRFDRLDSGHFWLSETPDVIGSRSWDSALPRMVTWVRLQDRRQPDAVPLVFLNTHFDHKGPQARLESARLLRQRVESLRDGAAVIVSGDFNAGADSDPHGALFGEHAGTASPLVDSFRIAHPVATGDEGTFSGFEASETKGARIDWIGVSRDWTVVNAAIDRTARDGRTPSDHCPVTAVIARAK
jgi:endonuclease/exonuclease/phosphatase family metal-dependent hydrolase